MRKRKKEKKEKSNKCLYERELQKESYLYSGGNQSERDIFVTFLSSDADAVTDGKYIEKTLAFCLTRRKICHRMLL